MRAVTIAMAAWLALDLAQAQPTQPAQPAEPRPTLQGPPDSLPPPAPTGLIVGSNNYFSPIVRDLDKAVAFYRDGLGLEPQGAPGDASNNAALRDMFGLPNAKLDVAGDRATMAFGAGGTVELVRERGVWKVEDLR